MAEELVRGAHGRRSGSTLASLSDIARDCCRRMLPWYRAVSKTGEEGGAMYGRLVILTLGPGMRDIATSVADESFKLHTTLDGFEGVTFFMMVDEEKGEYGSLSVWKTQADAEKAAETLRPWIMEKIGDKLKGPPDIRTVEIYQPA